MSTPTMEGFKGIVPYSTAKYDDSDTNAFRMPVVEPGGETAQYNAHWYNFGYAYLYNGELSLVVGATMDKGDPEDTLDVMRILQSGGYILNARTPANSTNTALWTVPLPDPLRPFIDYFKCGISWRPPLGATVGIIRKCFQWDGSYYPDTWDFIYYPLGNGYGPDSSDVALPFTRDSVGVDQTVEADVQAGTGYRVTYAVSDPSNCYNTLTHYLAGEPWYDSVSNATGWCCDFSFKTTSPYGWGRVELRDDVYETTLTLTDTAIFTADGQSYTIDTATTFVEVSVRVIGTVCEVWINGTKRITYDISPWPFGTKYCKFSAINTSPSTFPCSGNVLFLDYIKYFLNGAIPPVY